MHIGMDVRKYLDFGIGTYIQNLLGEYDLLLSHPLTVFARPEDRGRIAGKHRCAVETNSSRKYSPWGLLSLARQAARHRIDVFHAPHYTLPYGLRAKKVVTVHDLIHLKFPRHFSPARRAYARTIIGHACSAADAVVVDSQFTKDELLREFAIDPGKVRVIYLGISDEFRPSAENRFSRDFLDSAPYLLYVGSLKPHKNIPVLLKAFARMPTSLGLKLVFIGEKLERKPELRRLARNLGLDSRIVCPGRVIKKDLVSAYQGAAAVVLPSLSEGFGFSIVEAMASGVPALGARAASIPEVMGDAGIKFDPEDESDLANVLARVVEDRAFRATVIAKGLEQAKKFSWERCARETIGIYESVLGSPGPSGF